MTPVISRATPPRVAHVPDPVLRAAAYGVAALCMLLLATFLVLAPAGGEFLTNALGQQVWQEEVPFVVEMAIGGIVGALLAVRRPRNPVGWLLGLLSVGFLAFDAVVVVVAATAPSSALWVRLVAWLGNWVWALGHAGVIFLLLLVPTGRPLSPRWRVVGRVAAGVIALVITTTALIPGALEASPRLTNPFGIGAVGALGPVVIGALIGVMTLLVPVGAASLVLRFVRSRGVERQQLKWLAWGVAVLLVAQVGEQFGLVPRVLAPLGGLTMTAAFVVAVTRYRLFEIDRVVSRTVSYAALTAVLAGVYIGSVVLLQAALRPLTSESDLAVALSTLAVAALFGPLRRRVQGSVDRRFNRRRYDAAQAVEAFGQRLRDEVDLDEVAAELQATVAATVQPRMASLWLDPRVGETGR